MTAPKKPDARIGVVVMPLDPPDRCQWCRNETPRGGAGLITHEVQITSWFSWQGAIGRFRACEKHANEIAAAIKAQLAKP